MSVVYLLGSVSKRIKTLQYQNIAIIIVHIYGGEIYDVHAIIVSTYSRFCTIWIPRSWILPHALFFTVINSSQSCFFQFAILHHMNSTQPNFITGVVYYYLKIGIFEDTSRWFQQIFKISSSLSSYQAKDVHCWT
jgi:hypothetical protein